ncbi:MAG: heme-binding domain-containing protein [Polaribacter sp.]|nr:heme-binding domain-containing protein [Polaribacter sp.]
MKIIKKIGLVLLVALVIAQFFGPEKNESNLAIEVFLAETNPPKNVEKILQNACYDCHTNKTTYPWYSKITPVNYWLEDHVADGKKHLNFSDWANYSLKKKEHKMDELHEEVEKKEMPLNSYTWVHTDAKLTADEINAIVTWGKAVQQNYKAQLAAE